MLRIGGAILLLHLYALMPWTGTILISVPHPELFCSPPSLLLNDKGLPVGSIRPGLQAGFKSACCVVNNSSGFLCACMVCWCAGVLLDTVTSFYTYLIRFLIQHCYHEIRHWILSQARLIFNDRFLSNYLLIAQSSAARRLLIAWYLPVVFKAKQMATCCYCPSHSRKVALENEVKPQMHYKAKHSKFNEGTKTPVFLSAVLRLGVRFLHTPCLRTRKLCQSVRLNVGN